MTSTANTINLTRGIISLDWRETMEREPRPLVVAMKGHPGTGKSTLAHGIAAALRCPLLDKDDVRDCFTNIQQSHHLLNDLSYSVLRQIIRTQLSLGLDVVVDSPLSRRAHLDELCQMEGPGGCRARVVVVECRPGNEEKWRRRLEERGRVCGAGGHKPATWDELQRLVEGYAGCCDYEMGGDVERIVVDTTGEEEVADLVNRIVEFVKSC